MRIVHVPSGITVTVSVTCRYVVASILIWISQCQKERSQHRNKAHALSLLKSRLYEVEMQKRYAQLSPTVLLLSHLYFRAQSKANAHSTLPEIGWGMQIRSYVLHPYQLIKDARTGYEVGTSGSQAVLDGELSG